VMESLSDQLGVVSCHGLISTAVLVNYRQAVW
jgi:hypothetical protein